MSRNEPLLHRPPNSVKLDDHARDNLRFIRETMERAGSFTAVPGWGGVAIGVTALGAAAIADRQSTSYAWLVTWGIEAFVAISIAVWTTLSKARGAGTPLLSGPGRRFVYSFAPALFVGALLTLFLVRANVMDAGSGNMAAALRNGHGCRRSVLDSSRPVNGTVLHGSWVPWRCSVPGVGTMLCSLPGFGGLHVIFGAVIARNYGG